MLPIIAALATLVTPPAPPPAPAYVAIAYVHVVAAAGPTAVAQTAAASACPDTAQRLWKRVCYATPTRPAWLKARTVADLDAALAARPALTIDGELQGGYVRESDNVVVVGDPSHPFSPRYLTRTFVCPVRSMEYARGVVAAIYSGGRRTLEEHDGLVSPWRPAPPGVEAARASIVPFAAAYFRLEGAYGPRVVTSSPPKEILLAPYDDAVLDEG